MAGAVDDDRDDTLVLSFGTDRPISASDIGMLLRDLSTDYTRATGGRLVLWRYETGSSWIYLRDAIAVAGSMAGSFSSVFIAVQHMATFVKFLAGQLEQSKDLPNNENLETVAKSAARIVKIAADSNADINLRYKKNEKAGIEEFSLSLDNHHAKKLHAAYSRQKTRVKAKTTRSVTSEMHAASSIEGMTRQLIAGDGMSDDLVDAIIMALKASSGDHVLPSLASSLEAAGRYDIAQAVRRHITGPDRSTVRLTRD